MNEMTIKKWEQLCIDKQAPTLDMYNNDKNLSRKSTTKIPIFVQRNRNPITVEVAPRRKATSDISEMIADINEMYKNHNEPKLLKMFNVVLHCTNLSIQKSTINILITIIKYFFIFIMFTTMLAGSILIFRLWLFSEHFFDPNDIQLLVIHVSYIEGTFNFAFLLFWQRKNTFAIHYELLLNANSLKGTMVSKKQIKLLCMVLLTLSIVFIIFGFSSGIFLIESKSVHFVYFAKLRKSFFDERLHYMLHVNILYIIFSITICFSCFAMTCFLDKIELRYLNDAMEKEKLLDATRLKFYIDKHTLFVKVVEQANNIFKFYICKSYMFIIPLIVLILYDVAIGDVALETKIIYGLAVAYFTTYTVVINMLSASVNSEIWRTTLILFEQVNCHDAEAHPEVFRIVTWFTHKAVHKPVGFTIGGFIHISNHLLLTAISAIATFLLFLIQTYPTAATAVAVTPKTNSSAINH